MKYYFLIVCVYITLVSKIVNAVVYMDNPGSTVVVSNTISDRIFLDYYTPTPPGTHLQLVPGGSSAETRIYNYGRLTVSGGSVLGELWFYGNSAGNILSGNVSGYVRVTENSRLTMSGGTNSIGWMGVFDSGQAQISGGYFGDLNLSGRALVNLHGRNFKIAGQPVSGLLDIPQLVGQGLLTVDAYPEYSNIQYRGVLSGTLLDGTFFNSNISIVHFTDGRGAAANINLVPEPATFAFIALGGLALRQRKRQ